MNDAEKLVRRFFDEAVNGHNLDLFDELCSPDYVWHGGSDPGAPRRRPRDRALQGRGADVLHRVP